MTASIARLYKLMEKAAARSDFEEAAQLRDRISLIRAVGGNSDDDSFDTSGLTRQQPGKMGLGTSQQQMTPPIGWTPPAKPDPMTSGKARPRGRKR
jgi:hypothetical protein